MKKIALILVVLLLVAGAYLLPNLKPEAKNETTGNTAVEPAPVSDQTGPGVPQEPGRHPMVRRRSPLLSSLPRIPLSPILRRRSRVRRMKRLLLTLQRILLT
jgi:hypothetical protein